MYSASCRLKEEPRVFIIGAGGCNDLWAAKACGASFIKAVELVELYWRVVEFPAVPPQPRQSGATTNHGF